MMRGVGLVVLTQEAVRQRSDRFHTVFELRSLLRPCLSFGLCCHCRPSIGASECLKLNLLILPNDSDVDR